jgi:hypothetical protein
MEPCVDAARLLRRVERRFGVGGEQAVDRLDIVR